MSEKRLMTQKSKENTLESIMAFYLDDRAIKLTPKQKEQKNRCEAAFTMLIENEGGVTRVVKKLCKLYGIDKATAYRTLNQAEFIFGSVKKFNKDAWRFIQIERKRRHIKSCIDAGKWELVVKLEDQIDKLIGFMEPDSAFDPDKIKAQSFDIVISKELEKAVLKSISKGSVDMNSFEAEDISYETVE